jgi:hypothetical protein
MACLSWGFDMGAKYHADLQCYVDKLEYDFRARTGGLYADGYTDMDGCIRLFQHIDPNVRLIRTFVRLDADTIYKMTSAGTWEAARSAGG